MAQLYALVFRRDFLAGAHWSDALPEPRLGERRLAGRHRASADDPDRRQDWRAGDLYSTGTVLPDALPDHLEAIEVAPPAPGERWDRAMKAFRVVPQELEADAQAAVRAALEPFTALTTAEKDAILAGVRSVVQTRTRAR